MVGTQYTSQKSFVWNYSRDPYPCGALFVFAKSSKCRISGKANANSLED